MNRFETRSTLGVDDLDLDLTSYVPADIRPMKMTDQRLCSSLLVGVS